MAKSPLVIRNSHTSSFFHSGFFCVSRPNYVKVKAMDEDMNEVIYEGTELLARAFCHEIDHLDGKMYTDLVEGELHRTSYEED